MKTEAQREEYQATTRDYLLALAYNPSFLKLLDSSNKPYIILLSWLLENENNLKDDDTPLPTIKILAEQLKLKSNFVTKYLKQIYDDICELNQSNPSLFIKDGDIPCYLSFNFLGNYAGFNLGLKVIPRVSERIDFSFIKPKLGGNWGYVKTVYHDIIDGKHEITISLSTFSANNYYGLLKEKAYLHHHISLMEFLSDDESNHKLQGEILKLYTSL